jgi:hypothetical protein
MQMMNLLVGQLFVDTLTKIDLQKMIKLRPINIGQKIIVFHQM